ncbi:uncharacterized protein LOC103511028 [Diaphorina citri]|uniref:Uncharacterized protein LOC103511028 n=1 Tax=Diaphorina citri TaxID=121845 RepID=A0A1S4EE09_DIACI|nr:uncharacterized protein LOC103511028 [Diaphorina citri]
MNSLKKINVFCGSQIVKNSVRSMSKEIFPPSQEPEIPAYQERVGEPLELRKASDSNLSWNVDLEQQSPVYENVEEEPVLTSLVREQYMKRLLQCLHENSTRYDKSKDVGDGDAKSHRLERRAHALEKKALRSCMVAKLYIRSMLTITPMYLNPTPLLLYYLWINA